MSFVNSLKKPLAAIFLLLSFLLNSQNLQANDEYARAEQQLERMNVILDELSFSLEREDLARLYVLQQAPKRVQDVMKIKGLANMATIREYQVLIVTFRFSHNFFSRVETTHNESLLRELLDINTAIIEERGFDDSPYTQLILSSFQQIHQLMSDLVSMDIPNSLRSSVEDIIPDVGLLLAVAKQGDRPRAFDSGKSLYPKIRALYPEFAKVAASNNAFQTTLAIQGLNEFFAEYAQIEDQEN